MTQRYVAGELSALIGDLCRQDSSGFAAALRELRYRVECAPLSGLALLAAQALDMADATCWAALERGDLDAFTHRAADAAVLREFAVCAALLP